MEKDDQISGNGNSYTAEFWQYDSRLGRRWNIDPVKKSWQSDYSCFSNSPIWKVDPNGDDDFFNSDGSFSHSTKTGSKIIVQTASGNLLLTQVNLNSSNNRQVVANVVGYYANQVGITFQSKGSEENKGKGIVGLGVNKKHSSEKNPAFTTGNNILINKRDNKINSELSDYHNLKSVLIHEKDHKTKGHGFDDNNENNFEHAQVYLDQIQNEEFAKGTESFQRGIIGSMAGFLKRASIDDGYQDSDIRGLVEETNKSLSPLGYQMDFSRTGNKSSDIEIKVYQTK